MAETVADRIHLDRLPEGLADSSLPDLVTLRGRKVLLTGGGGANLGQALATRLASLGADLFLVDMDGDAVSAVARQVDESSTGATHWTIGDVTDPEDVERFVGEAHRALGGLDVVVHSAGGGRIDGTSTQGPFLDLSPDALEAVVRLNLLGAMYVSQVCFRRMRDHGGRVIIIASEAAKMALPNSTAYSAAKTGVLGFVRSVAHEVGPYGVTIVAVCPGMMVSDVVVDRLRQAPAEDNELPHERAFRRIALERCCHPEEVANVTALLATDAASYVTGTSISVGGGMSD